MKVDPSAAEKFGQAENLPKKMRPAENPPGEKKLASRRKFFRLAEILFGRIGEIAKYEGLCNAELGNKFQKRKERIRAKAKVTKVSGCMAKKKVASVLEHKKRRQRFGT